MIEVMKITEMITYLDFEEILAMPRRTMFFRRGDVPPIR